MKRSRTSVFVDHFAPIVRIRYKFEPMRLNWVNSPPLLIKCTILSKKDCALKNRTNMNLDSKFRLLLPLPSHCPLLLLQSHLLLVRLVPSGIELAFSFLKPLITQPALLHQPLVRSQSGVGRGNVFLHLVQLASESAGDEINVDLCQRII